VGETAAAGGDRERMTGTGPPEIEDVQNRVDWSLLVEA
jgi:hypothetical protein